MFTSVNDPAARRRIPRTDVLLEDPRDRSRW
jgi:hypothetical protein